MSASGTCRICGGSQVVLMFRVANRTLVKCQVCDYVQVLDQPDAAVLDKIYQDASYFTSNKYRDESTIQKENERRLQFVRSSLRNNDHPRVLEVGCAVGDFIAHAAPFYEMHGFDISESAIEIARRRNPAAAERLWAGSIKDRKIPENTFDAVVMWDVIEHLWNPLEICQELAGCIKPGGYFFVSTPNIGAPVARTSGKHWALMTPPEHLGFFNRRSMERLFEDALRMKIVSWMSKGKWVNTGFLLYKVKRKFPALIPTALLNLFRTPFFSKMAFYVPTGDILYAAVQKPL